MTARSRVPSGALVFLYNHDAAHQIGHTVGILRELAGAACDFPLVCAVADKATEQRARDMLGAAGERVTFYDLSLPPALSTAVSLLDRIAPAARLARLRHHANSLRPARLIVSPERTCLYLKRKWAGGGPAFVFVPHGAGDRSVSYHPALGQFDHMLVSGRKVAEEMIAHGLASEDSVHVIGYPKFDLIDMQRRKDFFGNGQPTFLYNPHFDPHLSSWYDHGPKILNWFAFGEGRRFNLIFAPHVMLFRKRLHISPEHKVARRRPELRPGWMEAPNLLIDVASDRLFDMSYTLAGDAYIGDVSSQIYEFLARPRAAYFIDVHAATGRGEYAYPFWAAGERVGSAEALFPLLPDYQANAARHHAAQEDLFDYTFSRSPDSSSKRAADWLRAYMTSRT